MNPMLPSSIRNECRPNDGLGARIRSGAHSWIQPLIPADFLHLIRLSQTCHESHLPR